jgi:coniferyl-aldehyde dehydrogenase
MNAPNDLKALDQGTELDRLFTLQRAAFARERFPSLAVRRSRVQRVLEIVTAHEKALCAAVAEDFGPRSHHETRLA